LGIPKLAAAPRASSASREAIATISQRSAFKIPGITFPVAIFAVDRIPQRNARDMARLPRIRIDMAARLYESRTAI
jgi:hypothetical protein